MSRTTSPNYQRKARDRYRANLKAEKHTVAGPVLETRPDGRWRVLSPYTNTQQDQMNGKARQAPKPTVLAEGSGPVPAEWLAAVFGWSTS